MIRILGLFYLCVLFGLLLTACGSGPPSLAAAGEPTLVFIYTEG